MQKEKIEELESFESLVREYVAPYYFPVYGPVFETEKYIDEKVLYYLKLGLTSDDMKKKIEKRNKQWEEDRKYNKEQQEKARKETPPAVERKKTFLEKFLA